MILKEKKMPQKGMRVRKLNNFLLIFNNFVTDLHFLQYLTKTLVTI